MTARSKSRADWLKRANDLSTSPGVYLMKDADGRIVYVGKAKNLKQRVRSYFQEGTSDYRAFIGLLARLLSDIETFVTASEKEALLLERELIRKHEPRFNIIWRDDKQYLCLRVDTSHEFPWVQVVRQMGKDGARYFGPFHSASAARSTLRVVNRHFQLRTCRDSVLYNRTRPCLEYQIGRCPAPCVFEIDRAKYREGVDDVLMFLEGKGEELVTRLESRMWGASERLEFEVAAHYRNQITAVNKTLEKQRIALPSLLDQDVYGLYGEVGRLEIAGLVIRNGRIENVVTQLFDEVGFPEKDLLESFLLQRYSEVIPPPEILVPFETDSAEALSELLSERRGTKVVVKVPQRGDRVLLLEMARENAENSFREALKKTGALEQTLAGLKEKLRLRRVPEKIECYDISNMGGMLIVGSRVSFVRALPNKHGYRHYKVKSTKGQDDFASMYEVLSRRLRRAVAENDFPDLLVIDGGKGQLNAARAAIKDSGIAEMDVVSLAKSRVIGVDDADVNQRSPERVFVPNAKDPIVLKQDSAELLLLARIRDEAHRFAITFQRKLRQKQRMRSALEDIPGVGAKRKTALLKHLGSLKRVRAASVEALAAVPGMGKAAAARVFAFFHAPAEQTNEARSREATAGEARVDASNTTSAAGAQPKSQRERAEDGSGTGEAPTAGGSRTTQD